MIQIDSNLISELFAKAEVSDRKRMNYDLRTSAEDGSQRMLNALLPGTVVPIHRHPMSTENVLLLCGKLVEVIYDVDSAGSPTEKERINLEPSVGNFGCVVPAGAWHTVEVLEPSVIYEAKDGKYGEDGTQSINDKRLVINDGASKTKNESMKDFPESCLGDLRSQITYLIGMERHSGSMEVISPLYVSRMLNVPLEEVEQAMMTIND